MRSMQDSQRLSDTETEGTDACTAQDMMRPFGNVLHGVVLKDINTYESRGFGWDANPWVVAVTFTAHQHNIDQMEANHG